MPFKQITLISTQVAGWGYDENFKMSEYLKLIRLPIVDTKECFSKVPYGFRKYFTYTSFCAGFLNGNIILNTVY